MSSPGWTGATGAPTRLMLLRHGQTELSVHRRYSGRGNPELTDVGRQQAEVAAADLTRRLHGQDVAVVSSPLQRATATADAVASQMGATVSIDEGFIETDFGQWEGLTFSQARERDPDLHARWMTDTATPPPMGESFDEVSQRIAAATGRLLEQYAGRTVVVVSHVTPIKMVLREALSAGPQMLYRLHLDLASLSVAEFYPDGPMSVRLVNYTPPDLPLR